MTITSRDVAREAGVSQSTVSRALNGDPRISQHTRLLVAEVARRLSYVPHAAARSLTTNRTLTVGTVVANITDPFYPELLDALHGELTLNGYRMVLFRERTGAEAGDRLVPLLVDNALDGVVFTTATLKARPVETLVKKGVPVVLLNRYVDGLDVDRVTCDNIGGGELAAQFLVELGHRRIGVISGPEHTSTSRDRELGFRLGLERHGFPLAENLRRVGHYSQQSGYQFCLEILKEDPPPTAIFCGSDIIAFGALNAAMRMGLVVPRQLSIVGFDDIEMAGWEVFGLTTIRHPVTQMSQAAARVLVDRIEQGTRKPTRVEAFPISLVKRSTTAPPTI